MNINDLGTSKYLKKDDVVPDVLVTIKSCELENMAMDGEPVENKLVVHFEEMDKGLACNVTNARIIAALLGSEDTDDWAGKQVVLWNDKTISFQGRITGGIRVRENRAQPAAPPQSDDIPF